MRIKAHPFIAGAIALSAVTGVAVAGVTTAGEPADDPERPAGKVELRAAPAEEGTTARVVVRRRPGAPARLHWSTASGTAIAGDDFGGGSGFLQFRPGDRSKVIEIDVSSDDVPEGAETFTVALAAAPGLTGAAESAGATVTIHD